MPQPSTHPNKRVTIADLAESLDLAKSTVSLALRGSSKVRAATRERVQQQAQRLGYEADPILSAYSRRRRQGLPRQYQATIAILWPNHEAAHLQPSAGEHLQALGFKAEDFFLQDHPSPASLANMLQARGIPAIMAPDHPDQDLLLDFPWNRFVAVQAGVSKCKLPITVVRHNSFETMRLAWNRVRNAGCRRIGAVLPFHGSTPSKEHDKTLGAYQFLQQNTDPAIPALSLSVNDMCGAFPDWLRHWQPDVVIGPWPGFHNRFSELLQPRPSFRGYVALRAQPERPDVAGCLVYHATLQRAAVNYLHSAIARQSLPDEHAGEFAIVLEPSWQPGDSFPEPLDHSSAGSSSSLAGGSVAK
jgi:hypothetical protein